MCAHTLYADTFNDASGPKAACDFVLQTSPRISYYARALTLELPSAEQLGHRGADTHDRDNSLGLEVFEVVPKSRMYRLYHDLGDAGSRWHVGNAGFSPTITPESLK